MAPIPEATDLTELDTDFTSAGDFPRRPEAYLIVQGPLRNNIAEVPTDGELVVGRGAGSSVAIEDGRMSRKHARFAWESGELVVEDLGSRNGTLVNGIKLPADQAKRAVHAGDRVRVGSHELIVALVAGGSRRAGDAAAHGTPSREALDDLDDAGVVVADPKVTRLYGFARRVAASSATVLVLGETGSGKEVLAQQIHAWSRRASGPLMRINCGALPDSLVESELFGHEKGAFTGADRKKIGLAEAADKGTLFLDEVGEIPLPVQAKLLAMLEQRTIIPVGSIREKPIDIRVIAATHRDLTEEVKQGRFREDLYYRIGVVVLRVPPLRERASEIPLLAELFARKFAAQNRTGDADPNARHFASDAIDALVAHAWPGNIRELRNAVEHAMLVTEDGVVRAEHLPETVAQPSARSTTDASSGAKGMKDRVADLERQSIVDVLERKGGNRTHAALELGISLRSLLYKIKKYDIKD